MSSREVIIKLSSTVLVVLLLIALVVSGGLVYKTKSIFVAVACILGIVLLFIPSILVINKLINSNSKLDFQLSSSGSTDFILDRSYKEMLITVGWEIKGKNIQGFEHQLQISSEHFSTSMYTSPISSIGNSNLPPGDLTISYYEKDSNQIMLKNLKPGRYSIRTNITSAPSQIFITEKVQLFN